MPSTTVAAEAPSDRMAVRPGEAEAPARPEFQGIKTAPAGLVRVKAERTVMPSGVNEAYAGGRDLRGIQVYGREGGMSAYGALLPGGVTVCHQGKTLCEGRDYGVDYPWGKIYPVPGSFLKPGDPIAVDYVYRLRRVDALARDASGKKITIQGQSHLNAPELPVLPPGLEHLANLFVDYDCDGSRPEIFPVTSPPSAARTGSTSGRIPMTLSKIRSGRPVKIVCWGDSVTAGGDASRGGAYPDVFAKMLREKFPRANIDVQVAAVGGSNSLNWLEPEKYPFTLSAEPCSWRQVSDARPDLVTVEFVNDTALAEDDRKRAYEEILRRVRALGAELILITPHFTMPERMGFKTARGKDGRPYVAALKAFAREHRLGLADASARWERLADEGIPYVIFLKNSINHPDDRGHVLFAEELLKNFSE